MALQRKYCRHHSRDRHANGGCDRRERTRIGSRCCYSPLDVPPADNSAMDGYCYHHDDVPADGALLEISPAYSGGYCTTTVTARHRSTHFYRRRDSRPVQTSFRDGKSVEVDGTGVWVPSCRRAMISGRKVGTFPRGRWSLRRAPDCSLSIWGCWLHGNSHGKRVYRRLKAAVVFRPAMSWWNRATPSGSRPNLQFNRYTLAGLHCNRQGVEVMDLGHRS